MSKSQKIKLLSLCVVLIAAHNVFGSAKNTPHFSPRPSFTQGVDAPVINLNGLWQFSADPPTRFWRSPKLAMTRWDNILVPGEWLMQGFSVEPGTMAAYSREVEIPASWKGHVILLKCDGVFSDTKVFLNGKLAGTHQGGLTPFQLDLTDLIRPGKMNSLIIGVQNESLADTLASTSQYAAHALGGITRKLELFALPQTFVKSLHYTTLVDEDRSGARVIVDVLVANMSEKQAGNMELKVNISKIGDQDKVIPEIAKSLPVLKAGGEAVIQIAVPITDASLWDPEHPNLYNSEISLVNNNEIIQKTADKIGLREIEVVGNQVFVNGSPIKLRGVNRHEVHPTKGRSLSIDEWRADVHLFKQANVNYIRTSHYPPAEEFIALCDSIGLFVECEAPLCWIGHGANSNWIKKDPHSPDIYPLIQSLILETVEQYRNHPSVIIWSLANESAWGPNWAAVLKEVNELDPSRPVSFHDQAYGGFNNYGSLSTQIANIHYPGPNGPDIARKFERPLLFGEYAHLNTYNRQEIVTDPGVRDAWGRGLEAMWENMYHSTGCLGGAIWSGIDDVFYLPSGVAVGYGEWGPIDGWRRPKPEYYHLKKIYSPVKIVTRNIPLPLNDEKVLKIAVENRHLFTNLSELDIKWQLGSESGRASTDIPPGNSGILEIKLKETPVENEKLLLSFYSPQGYLTDSYSIALGKGKVEEQVLDINKPELIVFENRVEVRSGEELWSINAVNGKLESATKAGNPIISGGPELMMLPLSTGPCNTEHSLFIETLNHVCSNWRGRISGTGEKGDALYIEVEGSYDEADIKLVYWFGRKSAVEIEYEIIVKEDIDPRQIGLVFTMPGEFQNFSWERQGQWSTYPETHIGRTSGTAIPFPDGEFAAAKFGEKPENIWEADSHPMGINDFRATRDKLLWGSLSNRDGNGVRLISDGTGAIRPFVSNDKIQFLAAGFSTAGGDLFFSSHLKQERMPLKEGDGFKSKVTLRIY